MTIADIVLEYVAAYGPVTAAGVIQEIREQADVHDPELEASRVLTDLIRDGKIHLYEDAVSFEVDG